MPNGVPIISTKPSIVPIRDLHKVALIGNHAPRRCGIATFTTDLGDSLALEFPETDCFVLAMNDGGRRYPYPERVRFELAENDIASYRRAAAFLNVNSVDVVCIQHEYGIFGGKAGGHLLALLRELRMPVVTTLHTVLANPSKVQAEVMNELLERSDRIVVMSAHGARLVHDVHGIPEEKIDVIPHGIPAPSGTLRSKEKLGVEENLVILTFGLLSPDKGIEFMIEALPEIVARFPNVLYIILGATHPIVKEQQGETYRLSLETLVHRLGLESNVLFHDRFVSREELTEFLAAADIYVTPYLNAEQVTSGTLAYAAGAGKAVVSTRYSHAEEMLADGRGVLVPSRSAPAIAAEVNLLLADDEKRRSMGERLGDYANGMRWSSVAASYMNAFAEAREQHTEKRRTQFQKKSLGKRQFDWPATNLAHVRRLTDSTGILQHAHFSIPRYEDGYCLDDNARALLLMALLEDAGTDELPLVHDLASRYLAFMSHAFDDQSGRFRNFMSYSRSWLEATGSEDSHGRGVWALGTVVGKSRDPGKQSVAGVLFERALPAVVEFSSPRAWAFGLLGIGEYLEAFRGDSNVQAIRKLLAEKLLVLFQNNSTVDWPWFEKSVTYENARLSEALLTAGEAMNRGDMIDAGLRSLSWLVEVQCLKEGEFAPIGSNGFFSKGGDRAVFDQQPVEGWATVSACIQAFRAGGDEHWLDQARSAFGWFLGQNHGQRPLYDASTGGCRDGLHAERLNQNQGAESTLSFQIALLEMRGLDELMTLRPSGKKAHL